MATPKYYQKNPIFGTDLSRPISFILEDIRNSINKLRGNISDIKNAFPGYGEHIEYLNGYFTIGLKSLHDDVKKFSDIEIKNDDTKFGKSIPFQSRGRGMDNCPGCFICGGKSGMMINISGFVNSKQDGEEIITWFKQGAYLDFRQNEPTWIQVKIGSCREHESNLAHLSKLSSRYNVIRKQMIEDSKNI